MDQKPKILTNNKLNRNLVKLDVGRLYDSIRRLWNDWFLMLLLAPPSVRCGQVLFCLWCLTCSPHLRMTCAVVRACNTIGLSPIYICLYFVLCGVPLGGRNRNGERSQQSQPYRTSRGNWQFHPDILSSSTTSTRRFSPQLGKQINSPIHEANFFPVYGFVWNCSFAHRIIFIDMWYLSVNWEGVSGRRPTMCLHVTLKSICMASPIHGIAEDADVYASRAIIEPNSLRCLYIYPSNYPKYTCRPRQTCVSWRSMDFRRIVSLPLPFRGRQLCPQNAGIQRRCGTNIVSHIYEWILIWYGSARATYTNEIINRGTIK